ncbi:MAG TPA: hypothetical protein PLI97_07800, partial [Fluviicola sp.]|nr:hypothetical protein [Fluviicola sp.]
MKKQLYLLLLLMWASTIAFSQEMMLNGTFEECDGDVPSGSFEFSIEYASFWHNLIGTCDLSNPCTPFFIGETPCFGVGAGRFGLSSNGYVEYMYGQTLPLTAGQTYVVSFWVHKAYSTETIRKIGLAITESIPTPSIVNTTPLISSEITSTQCVQLKACFTAQSSSVHYITLGPFNGGGSPESILYLVDDVSVMAISSGTPMPESNISASEQTYCVGEQVILDGSGSLNETEHQWKIFLNGIQEIYNSGVLPGSASTFDVTSNLTVLQPGLCYKAELTVFGICKDVSTVEFCFQESSLAFISDGSAVCENLPTELEVTGDDGWFYTWSTGQSGTDLKNITVTPAAPYTQYSVTATSPEGCTFTKSITLNVSAQNNLAPWMNGINYTGEYTYYVSQGDAVFFNSLLSNDHANEEMQYSTIINTVPNGHLAIIPSASGGIFSFSWVTSLGTPVGEYHYVLRVNDQNSCNEGIDTFDFKIIVVCDQCPVCIDYENRTPASTPLPSETKAGKCIEAGLAQNVSTGRANVLFQAGASITLGSNFQAGPGFEALIDSTTCVTDCEDCCTDWAGFTYDPLPNPFYMNFNDSDPTNDFIQITDTYHPFCAYGAFAYSFEVYNRWGSLMNNVVTGASSPNCCWFESPAPENPINHASIWWNGYTLNLFNNWVRPSDGTYYYTLSFIGCNGQIQTINGTIQIGGTNPNAMTQAGTNQQATETMPFSLSPEEITAALADH